MKAFLLAIIALLVWVFLCVLVTKQARAEPVFLGNCSGVYLDKGYVLTAAHCVESSTIAVRASDDSDDIYTAKFVTMNPFKDFALYKIEQSDVILKPSKIACYEPKMRQHFMVKGWPAILGYTEVIGYVAGNKTSIGPWEEGYPIIAPVYYRNSGSGVYDLNEDVIGIVVGGIILAGLNVMVPATAFCDSLPQGLTR